MADCLPDEAYVEHRGDGKDDASDDCYWSHGDRYCVCWFAEWVYVSKGESSNFNGNKIQRSLGDDTLK